MEPISAIVAALALGAAAAAKDVASQAVKDAYAGLKALIIRHYPKVSVEQLEQAPQSHSRRAVVEEDLQATDAAGNTELATAAQKLIGLIEQYAPDMAAAIGVDLTDVKSANLRLSDVIATGGGVKVEHGEFSGDIEIHGVRAGVSASERQKSG
jgi:hypothetical protein